MLLRQARTLVIVQVTLGVAVGVLWRLWSPHTVAYVLPLDGGGTYLYPDASEAWVAGDGRFVVLSCGAGLIVGLLAWRLRDLRGVPGLATSVLGGLLGAAIAQAIGQLLSHGATTGAARTAIHTSLHLHAEVAVLMWAAVTAVVYTLAAGLSTDEHLGLAPVSAVSPVPLPSADFPQ